MVLLRYPPSVAMLTEAGLSAVSAALSDENAAVALFAKEAALSAFVLALCVALDA